MKAIHLRFGTVAFVFCANVLHADQVLMKNGDRVTGSIVKKDGDALVIKTDQFGVVTTSWKQVASIKTDKPVHVVRADGKTEQLAIDTASGNPTPTEITTIRNEDEQKAYERLMSPGWTQLWAGAANVGLAGTSGNARTLTFTTALTAARVTRTDKTTVYFNAIKASAFANGVNSDTAQAIRGGFGYNHNLGSRIFANFFNDWEYDKFQNLDLRFVVGAGAGFHAIKTGKSQLDVLGGGDLNHSKFGTPLTTNAAEVYGGDEYTLKATSTTTIIQSFRIFDDPSNSNYRVNFDVGSSTKISKWLNWNVSLSDRYLNHPATGRKTNDFMYTTGLGISFAR